MSRTQTPIPLRDAIPSFTGPMDVCVLKAAWTENGEATGETEANCK